MAKSDGDTRRKGGHYRLLSWVGKISSHTQVILHLILKEAAIKGLLLETLHCSERKKRIHADTGVKPVWDSICISQYSSRWHKSTYNLMQLFTGNISFPFAYKKVFDYILSLFFATYHTLVLETQLLDIKLVISLHVRQAQRGLRSPPCCWELKHWLCAPNAAATAQDWSGATQNTEDLCCN